MITIFHGDDIATSRNLYHAAKQKAENPMTFDGEKVSLTDLTQALAGDGLFGEKQSIFIENLLTRKKDSKELSAIQHLFTTHAADHEITLWEGKEVTKKQLETIKQAVVKLCKLPQALFSFLESLKPQNTFQSLKLFHQAIAAGEEEMIFFMLIRQTRLLLALHDNRTTIDEVKRMAPWQQGRLQKQAKMFSEKTLIMLYQKLAEIDLAQKTGKNILPLSNAIDFWLLSF